MVIIALWHSLEVVSPGSIQKDTEELVSEYALAGVAEYWIINPLTATVTVHVLAEQRYALKGTYEDAQTVESKLLTQWRMTAADMLAEA
ncbi:MAG: Uma2 family endonuclease [Leptolyngbyaceae cyanobacterium]